MRYSSCMGLDSCDADYIQSWCKKRKYTEISRKVVCNLCVWCIALFALAMNQIHAHYTLLKVTVWVFYLLVPSTICYCKSTANLTQYIYTSEICDHCGWLPFGICGYGILCCLPPVEKRWMRLMIHAIHHQFHHQLSKHIWCIQIDLHLQL